MPRKTNETDPAETVVAAPKPRRVSILERRLQNPFGEPSAPVRLKEAGLLARWFNSAIRPDQFWRAKEMGWTGVTPAMIADLNQIGFHTISPEGYVARGERAQEILMYMAEADYRQIQVAKTRKNLEEMKDYDKEKTKALNAFAAKHGGTAAEYMSGRIVGGVETSYERVERVEGVDE